MFALNWKKVLLTWMHKVADTLFNSDTLCRYEYPDISEFFKVYAEESGDHVKAEDLAKFLTVNYPDLDVEFTAFGTLSIADYVYVYSVLLYHACVTTKIQGFLDQILELPENYQNSVNKFFELVLKEETINRKVLKAAISASVSNKAEFQVFDSVDMPPTPTRIIREKNFELDEQQVNYEKVIEELKKEKEEVENELRKKLSATEHELEELHIQLEEKDKLIDEPDCTLQTNKVKASFQMSLNQKDEAIRNLEDRVIELETEIVAAKAQLKDYQHRNERLESELVLLEEEYNEELQFLHTEINQFQEEKASLETNYNELRKRIGVKRFESDNIECSLELNNNNNVIQPPKKCDTSSPISSPPNFGPCFDGLRRMSTINVDNSVGPDLLNVTIAKGPAYSPTDNLATLENSNTVLKKVNPKLYRQKSFDSPPYKQFFDNIADSEPNLFGQRRLFQHNASVENHAPLSVELSNPPKHSFISSKGSTSKSSFDVDVIAHNVKLVEELMEAQREVEELKETLGILKEENKALKAQGAVTSTRKPFCCIL